MRPVPTLRCALCGRPFRPKALSGGLTMARYCSARCRLLAWARRQAGRAG